MKNLNVFIFQQNWFHLGSLLESTITNEKKYHSINFFYLNKNLFVKPLDLHQDFFGCRIFSKSPESIIAKHLKSHFLDKEKFFSFKRVKLARNHTVQNLFGEINGIKDLQRIQWEKTSIGLATSSFLISLTKDSDPNLNNYRKLIDNLELTYFQIFQYLDSLNLNGSKDEIWICNGRPFHERTVVEYAHKNLIPVKYYEIGGEGANQERWILHENSPHDRIAHQDSIKDHFSHSDQNLDLVNEWFQNQRPGGLNVFSTKFHSDTVANTLGEYFVFFSSSDDEVSAISLDWDSTWENQLNAVYALISYFINHPKLKLVIRVHPNQKNKSENDKKRWKSLVSNSINIIIYNYDSNIDSYKLLSGAKGIFTYGSTIGVEAAYLKKPAALLSNSRWDSIIPHQYLKSKKDIADWVNKVNLGIEPKASHLETCYQGSLMWGYYMKTAGSVWKTIRVKKDFRRISIGYIYGQSLKPPVYVIAITRFSRFLRLNLVDRRFDLNKFVSFSRRIKRNYAKNVSTKAI